MRENNNNLGDIMNEVTLYCGKTSDNTQNVAASTEEQNASVEEISAASEELARMATELQSIVKTFKL